MFPRGPVGSATPPGKVEQKDQKGWPSLSEAPEKGRLTGTTFLDPKLEPFCRPWEWRLPALPLGATRPPATNSYRNVTTGLGSSLSHSTHSFFTVHSRSLSTVSEWGSLKSWQELLHSEISDLPTSPIFLRRGWGCSPPGLVVVGGFLKPLLATLCITPPTTTRGPLTVD